MKIFSGERRINFVDDNNVFVGYDYEASCCESFGWMLSTEGYVKDQERSEGDRGINPEGFQFDVSFLESHKGRHEFDEGGAAIFKMIHKDGRVLFLHLWNYHNGYYAHGFEMKLPDGTKVVDGSL